MGSYVKIKTSSQIAAKLLISNNVEVNDFELRKYSNLIFQELLYFSPATFLEIIDATSKVEKINVGECPHFGNVDKLIEVPRYVLKYGPLSQYSLGMYLKGRDTDKHEATRKYGETFGKTCSLLGLVAIDDSNEIRFVPTSLTEAFCDKDDFEKRKIVQRLVFRSVCIQILLKYADQQKINGYQIMKDGSSSTKYKKRQGIINFINLLREFHYEELDRRLDNIYWEEEES